MARVATALAVAAIATRAAPDSATTAAPKFFVHSDEAYEKTLLRCGVARSKNDTARWRADELRNPVANDPRGGVSAELQLCRGARALPGRVDDAGRADVFFACLHVTLNRLVGDCDGATPEDRLAPLLARIAAGPGFAAGKPHVIFGAAEDVREDHAYTAAFNALPFFHLAGQSHWPEVFGANRSLHIPYATAPAASTAAVRARAVAEAATGAPRDLLLYFKGSPIGPRRKFRLLKYRTFQRIHYELSHERKRTSSAFEADLQAASPATARKAYAAELSSATFCLIISGHTCTTRRLYDAVAAGCLPLYADCPDEPRALETTLDHSAFSFFYPLTIGNIFRQRVEPFLQCLRDLEANATFLRTARRALLVAADVLTYSVLDDDFDADAEIGEAGLERARPTRIAEYVAREVARRGPRSARPPFQHLADLCPELKDADVDAVARGVANATAARLGRNASRPRFKPGPGTAAARTSRPPCKGLQRSTHARPCVMPGGQVANLEDKRSTHHANLNHLEDKLRRTENGMMTPAARLALLRAILDEYAAEVAAGHPRRKAIQAKVWLYENRVRQGQTGPHHYEGKPIALRSDGYLRRAVAPPRNHEFREKVAARVKQRQQARIAAAAANAVAGARAAPAANREPKPREPAWH